MMTGRAKHDIWQRRRSVKEPPEFEVEVESVSVPIKVSAVAIVSEPEMALLTGNWLFDFFLTISAVFGIVYAYFRYQYQSWSKRGFPVPHEPVFPSGNFPGVKKSKNMDQLAADIYKQGKGHKVIGCYLLNNPIAMVRDLDLVKNILVKDFSHFHDRLTIEMDLKKDPLGAHLFLMRGQPWRNLRIKLTPTFTSGKMKMMYPTLIDVGKQLIEILEQASTLQEIEIKDILSRYTTDVISSVAFGIETNSLKNPDSEFRKYGQEIAKPDFMQNIMNLLVFACPKLAPKLPITFIPKHISKFFMNVVKDTMNYRIDKKVQRNDFFQLLLQLKTVGYVKDADNPDKELTDDQKFTMEQMASQAFLFFFAGFETSSSTMQFALYELALHPELQKLAQQDVDKHLEKHNGQLTYECLMEMDYLDRIVSETLRKYPVASILIRECNQEYPIPGTNLKFLPGDNIWFPLYGYHHDPEYYPNPEKFDPDRFLPEAKEARHHFAYLPFGEGPRNCIGNRFGLMQTKAGLAMILNKFTLSPSRRTPIPMVFDATTNILAPKGDMHLKISKRSTS